MMPSPCNVKKDGSSGNRVGRLTQRNQISTLAKEVTVGNIF